MKTKVAFLKFGPLMLHRVSLDFKERGMKTRLIQRTDTHQESRDEESVEDARSAWEAPSQ